MDNKTSDLPPSPMDSVYTRLDAVSTPEEKKAAQKSWVLWSKRTFYVLLGITGFAFGCALLVVIGWLLGYGYFNPMIIRVILWGAAISLIIGGSYVTWYYLVRVDPSLPHKDDQKEPS